MTHCDSCSGEEPRYFVLVSAEDNTAKGHLCQHCLDALHEFAERGSGLKIEVVNQVEFNEAESVITGRWDNVLRELG